MAAQLTKHHKIAVFALIAIQVLACSQVHAQAANEREIIAFLQNSLLTKAGGDCGSLTNTQLTPVQTPYGSVGGGTMSSYTNVSYGFEPPLVNQSGEIQFSELNSFHSTAPGALVGSSNSTDVTLSNESITLSQLSPTSIAVISGSCGTGVKLAGTNGGVMGSTSVKRRRMNRLVFGADLNSQIQTPCSDKETKKKTCSENQYSLTEETIFFPNNPDVAPRFAAALQQLVILRGGRPDAF